MVILGERMAEHHEALKALVTGDKAPLRTRASSERAN
jgi:hypothetical protein